VAACDVQGEARQIWPASALHSAITRCCRGESSLPLQLEPKSRFAAQRHPQCPEGSHQQHWRPLLKSLCKLNLRQTIRLQKNRTIFNPRPRLQKDDVTLSLHACIADAGYLQLIRHIGVWTVDCSSGSSQRPLPHCLHEPIRGSGA
jgi:hypothetical protein